MMQWVCETCGEPCDLVEGYEELDYEYGSTSGLHRVPVDLSHCCRAEVYEEDIPDGSEDEDEENSNAEDK